MIFVSKLRNVMKFPLRHHTQNDVRVTLLSSSITRSLSFQKKAGSAEVYLETSQGKAQVASEMKRFEKFVFENKNCIEKNKNIIFDDYVATSSLESHVDEAHNVQVSGPYEYFFCRERGANHANLFRRPTQTAESEPGETSTTTPTLVLDIDRLATYYKRPVSLDHLKFSDDHNFVAFLLSISDQSNHENPATIIKLFLKDVECNVTCELELPMGMFPADLELIVAPLHECRGNKLILLISSSLDGIRPSVVHAFRVDPIRAFGERKQTFMKHGRPQNAKKRSPLGLRTYVADEQERVILLEADDSAFFLDLSKSRDNKYLLVHKHSKVASEVHYLHISEILNHNVSNDLTMNKLTPRWNELQSFVNHAHGYFYVAVPSLIGFTSDDAELCIYRVSSSTQCCFEHLDKWEKVWPQVSHIQNMAKSNDRYILDDYDIFEDHIVVYCRDKLAGGDVSIHLLRIIAENEDTIVSSGNKEENFCNHIVKLMKCWSGEDIRNTVGGKVFEETCWIESNYSRWAITPSANGNFNSAWAKFSLSSFTIPEMILSIHLPSAELKVDSCQFSSLVSQQISCATNINERTLFESSRIERANKSRNEGKPDGAVDTLHSVVCNRVYVESSRDKYSFPLIIYSSLADSVVRPTLLIGYGAYGVSVPAHYESQIGLFLRNGWTVAVACARGGGELGKSHHISGKGFKKWNSFYDYKDCAEFLINNGYTSPSLLCASGNSAGGLVMGVMINNFGHLFRAVIMRNPFLDIAGSVVDESDPLTIHEYDEWGHVKEKHLQGVDLDSNSNSALRFIRSYSPCDNIGRIAPTTHKNNHNLPSVLITVGLQDKIVSPLNSLKWASLLREKYASLGNGTASILLNICCDEKHDGSPTVEDQCHNAAVEMTFLEKEIGSTWRRDASRSKLT